ncbi:PREDICTED: B-cell lymphoma 3 protein homolog [Branchiostoma belcheri]|uniref:B-cell lymphoma 3 protein homolog n=1 Tax=Branchiostoma belcheri TaxID=7741 RepID=A0A6P4Z2B5_BRABE|nr:PREDICTED: B-cell lymphoma 3 protein homolog [Branchiostoma belcheri]
MGCPTQSAHWTGRSRRMDTESHRQHLPAGLSPASPARFWEPPTCSARPVESTVRCLPLVSDSAVFNERQTPTEKRRHFVSASETDITPTPTVVRSNSSVRPSHDNITTDKKTTSNLSVKEEAGPQLRPQGAEEARPPPVHTVPSTLGRPHVPVPLSLPVPNFVDQRLGVFAPAELQQLSWQDEDGDTPLHIAVAQANVPLTERYLTLLAMAHRNIDIYNHLRQTPLHLAVITEQWPLVRMLVLSGACADVQDRNGQTAVHLSCQTASTACLHTILTCTTRELDLELRNYDGLTPLHVAVNTGNQDVAMLLVDSGADVDATDGKSGRTALFHAVERDQEDMVLYLLRAGAKVNAQCYAGNTPLHAASGRGQQNMVKLLIKHGADIGVKNSHNDTPLAVVKTRVISQMMRGRYKPQPPNAASAPAAFPRSVALLRESGSPGTSCGSSHPSEHSSPSPEETPQFQRSSPGLGR